MRITPTYAVLARVSLVTPRIGQFYADCVNDYVTLPIKMAWSSGISHQSPKRPQSPVSGSHGNCLPGPDLPFESMNTNKESQTTQRRIFPLQDRAGSPERGVVVLSPRGTVWLSPATPVRSKTHPFFWLTAGTRNTGNQDTLPLF